MKIETQKYVKYFSKNKFWEKIKNFAKKIGLKTTAYALILFYILDKDEVEVKDKMMIIGCLGYFILPLDLIPDFIALGYTDDVVAMIFALRRCRRYIDEEIREKVREKLKLWFKVSDEDLKTIVDEIKK